LAVGDRILVVDRLVVVGGVYGRAGATDSTGGGHCPTVRGGLQYKAGPAVAFYASTAAATSAFSAFTLYASPTAQFVAAATAARFLVFARRLLLAVGGALV